MAAGQISLERLPISPGYFRLGNDNADVRRCPDAGANCSGLSECLGTTSGCAGGRGQGVETCRLGLTGTYCRACVEPAHFYVAAVAGHSNASFADCESCHNVAASRSVTILLIAFCAAMALLAIAFGLSRAGERYKEGLKQLWRFFVDIIGAPTKLKILIGFYQIGTKIVSVYSINLPAEIRSLLLALQLTISLGIDGVPLACVGAEGYIARLAFWMLLPFVVIVVAIGIGAARIGCYLTI